MADETSSAPGDDTTASPESSEPSAAAKEAAAKKYADVQASVPPKQSTPEAETTPDAAESSESEQSENSTGSGAVPDDLSGLDEAGPAPADPNDAVAGSDAALAAERLADLQRLQAEYVNYKRRVDRDREAQRALTISGIIESLLPVLDEIHLARQHGDLTEGTPFAKIAEKLEAILTKYGVERYGETGVPFDPTQHEALMNMQAELPEGTTETTVVQVMQPGYRINDRIVRPAMVAVADPA